MIIKVKNDQQEEAAKSYLAASFTPSATGTTIYIRNINSFYDNWNVQLGETGEERTEIVEIAGAPSGSAINLAATVAYDHPVDTPVYSVKYNQVVFKRSTTGTAGTATAITDGTIGITADNGLTQFDDTTGSASYAYKACFRSTGLASNSSDSDWIMPAGFDFYSLAKIRERVKRKLPSSNYVMDKEIDDWVNEWLETMTNAAVDVNEDYALGTVDVAFSGTAQEASITSADFKQVRRAWYTEDGSDWYQMTKQEYTDFTPDEEFNETHPYYYMMGDSTLGRNPHDVSGTVRLAYYKLNSVLDSDADLLPTPMRGYTSSFVNWALSQAYRKDDKIAEAERLEMMAWADLDRFKKELTPRNKSGPTFINITEDFGDHDTDVFW